MEEVPKETETIKVRRSLRIAERLKSASSGLSDPRAWWSNNVLELVIIAFIVGLNFYLILPFFGGDAFETEYSGPILPLLATVIEWVGGVSTSHSLQIVNIMFFLLFPFSFFIFIERLSERKITAFLATLIISLPFIPFAGVRVNSMFYAVEGPHIASLSLVPFALFGLLGFLHQGGFKNLLVSAISSSLVVLTSPFGFITYLFFAGILLFSEVLVGKGRLKVFRFLTILFVASGLSSFWYNPAFFFWMITGPLGEDVRVTASRLLPISLFSLPVLATLGYLLFDRKPKLQPVFLATFFTIGFFMIVSVGGGFVPSHPSRYMAEFGISLSFFLSIFITKALNYLVNSERIKIAFPVKKIISNIVYISIVLLLVGAAILGKNNLLAEGENVLGAWDTVNKGDIWLARDQFTGFFSYLGYFITLVFIVTLSVLAFKSQSEKVQVQRM